MKKFAGTFFSAGQAVEFDGKPKKYGQPRPLIKGVVKDGPKGKHNYYEVSTPNGQFKVPATMLRPSKLDKKQAQSLTESGQKFDARREANRDRRDDAQLKDCQIHMDTFKLMPGMVVKNRGVAGWPQVQILAVDRDKGKCQVETSTAALMDKVALLDMVHGTNFGSLRRRGTRRTTWVLANRLYPV